MDGRLLKPTAMDGSLLYFFTFALNGPLLYIRNNIRSVAIEILQWRAIFEPFPLQLWPKMTYTLTQPMYKRRLIHSSAPQPHLHLFLFLRLLLVLLPLPFPSAAAAGRQATPRCAARLPGWPKRWLALARRGSGGAREPRCCPRPTGAICSRDPRSQF